MPGRMPWNRGFNRPKRGPSKKNRGRKPRLDADKWCNELREAAKKMKIRFIP